MNLLNWTFTLISIGISWIALLFALFQYLKKRGSPKKVVVGKTMFWGIGTIAVLYIVGIVAWVGSTHVEIYRLRVTVVDPQRIPVEDAKVWSSIGGEPKKVAGGWQFDIPPASRPKNNKLTIYASLEKAFLRGEYDLQLGGEANPSVVIQLQKSTSAFVRGIVVDGSERAIAGARVCIVGYETETVVTLVGGNFELRAHAAEGEQVLLHAEKEGYTAENRWHIAGNKPITLILKKE